MKIEVFSKMSYLALCNRLREVARSRGVEFISFWIVRDKSFSYCLLLIKTANAQVFKIEHCRLKTVFDYLVAFQWRLLQTALNSIFNLNIWIRLSIKKQYWNTTKVKVEMAKNRNDIPMNCLIFYRPTGVKL